MTMPKGILEWLNSKAGTTISMFLAGAIVVLVATGKIQLPWSAKPAEAGLTEDMVKVMLKEQLDPISEEQKRQADKVENLGLEVAKLQGRMQLAGLNAGLGQMGAGRRN